VLTKLEGSSLIRLDVLRAALLIVLVLGLSAVPAGAGPAGPPFFTSTCTFSHMSFDDPIVWPGRPGYSHNHTFIGNVSTNAFSTPASLRGKRTTCAPAADTAAYWAPSLYVDGNPLAPVGATVYYRRLTTGKVRPFPAGLEMVAGNSHAVRPQSHAVTYWDCSVLKTNFYGVDRRGDLAPAQSSSIPQCPVRTQLQLNVNFPECWDGKGLRSTKPAMHVVYAVAGRCPASHPVALPALQLVYKYPAAVVSAAHTVILSSGGQYSGHADFVNAWQQSKLTELVDDCLNHGLYCQAGVSLG
jgi:Domain of unknown function (DUF1996)